MLQNLPELSLRVPFIFLVMARHIEILEPILNKNVLDLGHEKGEDPLLPIMEMCDNQGGKKASCNIINTQTGY